MTDHVEALIKAGFVRRDGNQLVMTDKGRMAIREGLPKPVPIQFGQPVMGKAVALDSKLARSRPHVKKKGKR